MRITVEIDARFACIYSLVPYTNGIAHNHQLTPLQSLRGQMPLSSLLRSRPTLFRSCALPTFVLPRHTSSMAKGSIDAKTTCNGATGDLPDVRRIRGR